MTLHTRTQTTTHSLYAVTFRRKKGRTRKRLEYHPHTLLPLQRLYLLAYFKFLNSKTKYNLVALHFV